MSGPTTCENPRCSCNPCTCLDCGCGVARLGELERRVMDVLWEEPGREMTGRDMADAFPDYAYTTVATVLDRLVHKQMVSRRMEGRAIRFAATGTRAAHTAELMHETLVVTGDPDATLTRFAKTLSRSRSRGPSPRSRSAQTRTTRDEGLAGPQESAAVFFQPAHPVRYLSRYCSPGAQAPMLFGSRERYFSVSALLRIRCSEQDPALPSCDHRA